MILFVVYGHRW